MSTSGDARQEILTAAGPIFADLGFEKATIREICRAADVNIAAVNYYFRDKMCLYVEVVKRAHQLRSTQVPMPEWKEDEDPELMLRGFVSTLARRMLCQDESSWETRLLMREVLNPTEACRALVEDYFRPHMQLLMRILARILPPDIPESRLRRIAFSIVGQCLVYRVAGRTIAMIVPDDELDEHFQVEALADHIVDLLLYGIHHCPARWLQHVSPAAHVTRL